MQRRISLSALPLVALAGLFALLGTSVEGQVVDGTAPPSAFLAQLSGLPGASAAANATPACNATQPAKLTVESVTPIPAAGNTVEIVIRNMGGQTANLTGFRLTGTQGGNTTGDSANTLYIATDRQCRANGTLESAQALYFTPKSDANPCGFPFPLGANGTVTLSDYNDAPKSSISWTDAAQGTQIHVTPDASSAVRVPGNSNVIEVLQSLGYYQTFLLALKSAGLDQPLTAASDPNYTGPTLPQQQYQFELPWWFAGASVGLAAPPPPPPPSPPASPPPEGIPAAGPYTILAPTDDAFDTLLTQLGTQTGDGQGPLPLDALLRLPQLRDILLYHIVPGRYTSEFLRNNTPVYTAKGVEVVPFTDGCMTEGKLMLHDSCIDKPTADNFTCAEQKLFQKCNEPFMTDPSVTLWQGGTCQRTCQRCDCSPSSGIICSTVESQDIAASNGVIQGISRVLFPPPVFTKEQAIQQAVAYNESAARNASLGIPVTSGLAGLTGLPGAAPSAAVVPAGLVPPADTTGAGANATGATTPAGAAASPADTTGAGPGAGDAAGATGLNATGVSPEPAAAVGPPAGRRLRRHTGMNNRRRV